MMKVTESNTVVPVTITSENVCDFCGREAKTAHGDKDMATDHEELELYHADICYNCASQIAQLLANSAEVGEDGQVQL